MSCILYLPLRLRYRPNYFFFHQRISLRRGVAKCYYWVGGGGEKVNHNKSEFVSLRVAFTQEVIFRIDLPVDQLISVLL